MIKVFTCSLFYLSSLLIAFSDADAQEIPGKGKITGSVTDENQLPLPNADVSLLNTTDSTLISKSYSDGKGKYTFNALPKGNYILLVTFTGYIKYNSNINGFNGTEEMMVKPIRLVPDSKQLRNVNITAKKPLVEYKNDKTILNISGSTLAAGNSAFEILAKAPGVNIDNEGNISLKGKRGVTVMMDGKLTYLSAAQIASLLRATNAGTISTIELISSPSSRYDAAGSGGLINIKFKKNTSYGTNGTFTAGAGYGKYGKASTGIAVNHRNKNLNIFGNYNYDHLKDFENLAVQRSNTSGTATTYFHVDGADVNRHQNNSYKAGIDYIFNDRNILGFMATGYANHNRQDAGSTTQIGRNSLLADSSIQSVNPQKSRFSNQNYNLNFKSAIDTAGQEFNADADYSNFRSINEINNNNYFYHPDGNLLKPPVIFRSATPSNIRIMAAKADYTYPISSKSRLETGLKSSYVKTDNNYQFENLENNTWLNDPLRSNRFIYKELIHAGYVNYHREFRSTTLQLGLRAEQTHSEGNSPTIQNLVKRSYLDFFPNLNISQTLSAQHEISLAYNRRIDRPDYQSLNPFVYFTDLYTLYQGNPLLNPQYTNSFTFSYNYQKKLNVSFGYSRTNDVITSTFVTDTIKKTLLLSEQNLALQTLYDMNASLPVAITRWWQTSNDLSVFQRTFSTPVLEGNPFRSSKLSYSFNTVHTFTVSPSVSAEAAFNYQSPQVYGTYLARPIYSTNLGISKSFANHKASLKLAVNDLFNTQQIRIRSTVQRQDYRLAQKTESRIFRLTFTYNFGSSTVKAARERDSSASGEQQRVKSGI